MSGAVDTKTIVKMLALQWEGKPTAIQCSRGLWEISGLEIVGRSDFPEKVPIESIGRCDQDRHPMQGTGWNKDQRCEPVGRKSRVVTLVSMGAA